MKVATIKQKVVVPASPEKVYDAFMDAEKHSVFTGSKATCNPKIGGKFTAWNGYISGKNLELEKEKKSLGVDNNRMAHGYSPSRLELTLKKTEEGTEISMIHSHVLAEQANDLKQVWIDFYWKPLKEYFKR